ncbi:hypothetical protein Tco_0247193 [Tanacetum coccineum]
MNLASIDAMKTVLIMVLGVLRAQTVATNWIFLAQRSITEGARPDDEANLAPMLLVGIANGSSKIRSSLWIGPEDHALAERKMFRGEFNDHPRGTLQLNAMQMAEIYAAGSNFKSFISDPIEEDVHLEFDSVAAAGEILGVIPRLDASKSTYSTSRALG